MLTFPSCRSFVIALLAVARVAVAADAPPPAPREFRAAWVATVENIDWPSKPGLSTAEQRREILAILDRAAGLKLNCLIVQVRTTCDALYPSTLEPWSLYLTGVAGQAPVPFYDPLQTWIDESHRRGIELHAWFNPYRARLKANDAVAASHVSRSNPDLVVAYGDKLWLDPGEPMAARRAVEVINDVTRRYDIDGVHIDDYFYPYPAKDPQTSREIPFPDDNSWRRYKQAHPIRPNASVPDAARADEIARADWRRENVNRLVEQLYASTKRIKPRVKFGISPFGIGRKGKVPGIAGMDQYDALYADAALWLRNGWCDYFTPQLYWSIAETQQSFPVLFDYWRSENRLGRHVWPGLFTSRVSDRSVKRYALEEIGNQIKVTRERPDPGHVHFSMKALLGDEPLGPMLRRDVYQTDALVPPTPWLGDAPPPAPEATLQRGTTPILKLTPGRGEPVWRWAIWLRVAAGRWSFQSAPGDWRAIAVDPSTTEVVVTAVDRCGNESSRVLAK